MIYESITFSEEICSSKPTIRYINTHNNQLYISIFKVKRMIKMTVTVSVLKAVSLPVCLYVCLPVCLPACPRQVCFSQASKN